MSTVASFIVAENWRPPRCPSFRWVGKSIFPARGGFALQGDIWQLETLLFVPVGKGNAIGIHWLETGETVNHPMIQRMRIIWPTWQ